VHHLIPLPAFQDNYLWLLHDGQRAIVVDPGDATPVLACLQQHGLQLAAVLLTHHHADHTGGVAELRAATGAAVYAPAAEAMPATVGPVTELDEGDRIQLLGLEFELIAVPGHTAGHAAYYAADAEGGPLLFCGDTLFSAGCGRLFEGTPAQMLASLDRLAALPDATRVCCAHEYTVSNLRFALAVEPGNADIARHLQHCQQLREQGLPTLPSSLALERLINPFLRSRGPAVVAALAGREPQAADEVARFAALREWKNGFR
jgi:hydroxyacylglutathione hydrolase